jgi:hypothetical protein
MINMQWWSGGVGAERGIEFGRRVSHFETSESGNSGKTLVNVKNV